MLHQQLDAVRALGAGAPTEWLMSGAVADHVARPLHHIPFLLAGQLTGAFVMIAMACDFMPLRDDGLYRFRITFGDTATGIEGDLDLLLLENAENAPDAGVRPIFALGPFLIIERSIRKRAHVLPALEIQCQDHGGADILGPEKFAVVMVIPQH